MGFHNGGTLVSRGVYWNPVDGHDISIKKQGILPGNESRKYMKISTASLLIIAPLLGMAFILFLPLFGIGVLLTLCAIPVIKASFEVIASAVRVCSGLHSRRIVHKWGFSGRAYKRVPETSNNMQVKTTETSSHEIKHKQEK